MTTTVATKKCRIIIDDDSDYEDEYEPTITIVNKKTYEDIYEQHPDWCDMGSYVDKKKLRKNVVLPKGSRVLNVMCAIRGRRNFKNVSNKKIPYEYQVLAYESDAGSYPKYCNVMRKNQYFVDSPIGDVVIVVNKL